MNRTLEQVRVEPIFQALNPKGRRFMRGRVLPPSLNRFAHHIISVTALISFGEFPHIKTVPTFQMMLEDLKQGLYRDKHTLVVDSSGNTAYAAARLAPAFGFREVKVVLPMDVPESKKGILAALSSVEIIEVGGGKSVADRAIKEALEPGHYHLNQYAHMGNVHAHKRYTGPEVLRILDGNIAIIAIAMGSGGTASGVGDFLKEKFPGVVVLGVCPEIGDAVPGARDQNRMAEVVRLPLEGFVDTVIEVSRKESFKWMRRLWSAVEPQPGPTSGLACGGLMKYLGTLSDKDLKKLHGKNAAFICPDDGRFYSERTTGELDTGQGLM